MPAWRHQRRRAAEDVVGGRIGAVEADADPANAALLDLARHVGVDERAVGGQGDDQAGVAGVAGDVKDVGPEERFAAGEHEDRACKGRDLVDEVKDLLGLSGLGAGVGRPR